MTGPSFRKLANCDFIIQALKKIPHHRVPSRKELYIPRYCKYGSYYNTVVTIITATQSLPQKNIHSAKQAHVENQNMQHKTIHLFPGIIQINKPGHIQN